MAPPTTIRPAPQVRSGIEVRRGALVIGVLSTGGTALLRLEGELDAASAPALIDIGLSLVDAGNPDVVLDCGLLDLCDSAGLHALTAIRRAAGAASLTVVRANPTVRRLITLAGLDDLVLVT